jgi:cation transport ATPase
MLGFAYVFLTAKPISMRRLSALFVVALILSLLVFGALHMKHSERDALFVAASLTMLVWSNPLLRALRDSLRYRRLSLDALRPVSTFVRCTYGFALVAAPLIGIEAGLMGTRGVHLAVLLRLVAVAGLVTLVLYTGSFCSSRRPGIVPTDSRSR